MKLDLDLIELNLEFSYLRFFIKSHLNLKIGSFKKLILLNLFI